MIHIFFENLPCITVRTKRDADKLRGHRYPPVLSYMSTRPSPKELELTRYTLFEILHPASVNDYTEDEMDELKKHEILTRNHSSFEVREVPLKRLIAEFERQNSTRLSKSGRYR